jgi:hypothetical protein
MSKRLSFVKNNRQVIRILLFKDAQEDAGEAVHTGCGFTAAGLKGVGACPASGESIISPISQSVAIEEV